MHFSCISIVTTSAPPAWGGNAKLGASEPPSCCSFLMLRQEKQQLSLLLSLHCLPSVHSALFLFPRFPSPFHISLSLSPPPWPVSDKFIEVDNRDMKEKNPWHRPVTIIITVIGVIAIVALVTVAVLQNKPLSQKYKYGIVLDAGSSHTALYIYQWPAEKDNDTGRVEQMHSCKVKGPGISSYASNPSMAGESLKECMREAQRHVPASHHSETSLYLGATAGMRLLDLENKSASNKVFLAVADALQKFPFTFRGARLLSGQEEGAFGWVTVNYLDDRLKQEFRLYGNDYQLYTHSFLCYGKDQALRLTLAHQTRTGLGTIADPCFHPGYNETKKYSDLYDSPCVSDRKPQQAPSNFTHTGIGNFQQCQEVVKKIFNFSRCEYSQCSFNGVFQPTVQGKYGGFSAYYFVMNFLNLTDTSIPLESVKEKLARHCATPWRELKNKHPDIKLKYLAEYCFSGTYIITLLTEGYNFTSETYSTIEFIKKIKGSDTGWTLGYMLTLTNLIPAEAPDTPPLPHAGYVSIVTVIALVLFVLFIFSLRPLWPRCSKQPQIV
uniref:Ectonucleoside triphosphate diphosphohydrolase 1 n=1 Tax=Cynoglossus semilaevis TaxID=244447 RepID=A0A3P8VJD1_CYNSE